MKNISILFLSIFFETLPFLLLGSFISAVIEQFVSEETIAKLIPKNVVLGSLVGIVLGFFLPACDCAVIPVSRRLIKKKVPLNVAVSFMLASPIINPVVLLSTYTAFYQTNFRLFVLRFIFGILIAFVVGSLMGVLFYNHDNIVVVDEDDKCNHCPNEEDDFKELEKYTVQNHTFLKTICAILHHAGEDLLDVMKFLMIGAFIASVVQVVLPREVIIMFADHKILSIVVLMIFAYLISLCSTSDAFVGKSLLSIFGANGVLAYLLLGPMIDIKNTVVLLGNYKKSFVVTLILLIFIFVFLFSSVVSAI